MKGICFAHFKRGLLVVILLAGGLFAVAPQVGLAQLFRRCDPCEPCPTTPSTGVGQGGTSGQAENGGTAANPQGGAESGPAANLFAGQDVGAAGGAASAAPNMIGDFFAGATGTTFTYALNATSSASITTTAPPPGGAIPRFKMAEDTSPIPTDRVYLDYDYYHNVQLNNPTFDVNAVTPGFEKTFFGGMMSFEMRLPMASTLSSNVYLDGTSSTGVGEIGDLSMALKCLLIQWDGVYVSGGLAMTVPTAKDSQYFLSQATTPADIIVRNQSVHLMPFVGAQWTNCQWFGIGYFQIDVDANGDEVDAYNRGTLNAMTPFGTYANIGRYQEPTMMYIDLAGGYWAFRCRQDRLVTGLAGVMEVHVNQSLNSPSAVQYTSNFAGASNSVAASSTISIVDLTLGAHAEVGSNATVTAGYCMPLTSQREFNQEFRTFINYRF